MPMSPRLLRPRASGAAFDPRAISGLGLWLDATVDSSLTFNSNTVSEWRDLSGNGRHFSQATAASQPDGANRKQNGRRVLDFDGTGDVLDGNAASLGIARNLAGGTLVVVASFDATGGGVSSPFTASTAASSTGARVQLGNFTANTVRVGGRRLDADSFQELSYSYTNGTPFIGSSVFDWGNSDLLAYQNGTLQASTTTFQTSGNTSDADSQAVRVGFGFGVFFDGFVGEVLFWRRVLSIAERQAAERHLGAKWGITVA